MTSIFIRNDSDFTRASCGNCGETYDIDKLEAITDIQERIAPGEEVPAGQCPDEECGALCYVVRDDEKPT